MCDIFRVLLSSTNALCKHSQRNDTPCGLCTIDLHGMYEYMVVKYAETFSVHNLCDGPLPFFTAAAVSDGVKIMQDLKKIQTLFHGYLLPCSHKKTHTHRHTHYILSSFEWHINPCVHGIHTNRTTYTIYEYHIKHFHSFLYLGSFFFFFFVRLFNIAVASMFTPFSNV